MSEIKRLVFPQPNYRSGAITPILDEIDWVLAAHYGFTDEELDFPSSKLRTGIPSTGLRAGINYDIKYRMGRDKEADEE